MSQPAGMLPITTEDYIAVPFIRQKATSDVAVFRQSRSVWPSLLKSPVPPISQLTDVTSTPKVDCRLVPFIRQNATAPVLILRQRKSGFPLLVKPFGSGVRDAVAIVSVAAFEVAAPATFVTTTGVSTFLVGLTTVQVGAAVATTVLNVQSSRRKIQGPRNRVG